MLNVGLNGLGRIGKAVLRYAIKHNRFRVTAINDLNPSIENMVYVINYDTTYGRMDDPFYVSGKQIKNRDHAMRVFHEGCLTDVPWQECGVDIVIDATGTMRDTAEARVCLKEHALDALFCTHPLQSADLTMVLGVNEDQLDPARHKIISSSSCNATAILPALKLLEAHYGIAGGFITTIHPWLGHQNLLDGRCLESSVRGVDCNFEFGRAAPHNLIAGGTTTIRACSHVLSKMNETLIGSLSVRAPVDVVGCIDATLRLNDLVTTDEVIALFEQAQATQTYDIVLNNFDALVSSDFKAMRFTTIIDHRFTQIRGDTLKLLIWYDNEMGYASKVAEHVSFYHRQQQGRAASRRSAVGFR